MMTKTPKTLFALIFALALPLGAVACGSSSSDSPDAMKITPPADAMPHVDAPPTTPDADCVMNPTTNVQFLNACTTSDRIAKDDSHLPLLLSDGGLPALP